MAKAKSIRDNNNGTLQATDGVKPDSSKRIELTNANAPVLATKFLEGILIELRKMRELLEKQSG